MENMDKDYISLYCRWLGFYFLLLIFGALSLGSVGSLLKLIGFIPVIIWLIFNHYIVFDFLTKCTIPFVLICALSILWSIDTSTSVSRTITQVSFLVLLISASSYSYNKSEINYLRKCLVWSSRITAIIVLLTGTYSQGRLLLSGIITENPNYLCAYFMFGIIGACDHIITGEKLNIKLLSIFELLIYIYITLSTGSRGGLMASIATLICFIIVFDKSREGESRNSKLPNKIFLIAILLLLAYIVTSSLSDELLNRFSAESISTSDGSGRYELWEDSIQGFNDSSIFRQLVGYGTGTAKAITRLLHFRINNVIHNIFLENLLEIGLMGLVSYLIMIISFTVISLRTKNYFAFAIIVGMIVISISSSIYAFKPYWNCMLFIVCFQNSLDADCEEKELI